MKKLEETYKEGKFWRKLAKQRMGETYKFLFKFYAAMLVVAAFARAIMELGNEAWCVVAKFCVLGLLGILAVVTLFANVIRIWKRFRTTLFVEDDPLPRKVRVPMVVKYSTWSVTATMTLLVTILVIIASITISLVNTELLNVLMQQAFGQIGDAQTAPIVLSVVLTMIVALFESITTVMIGLLAIILGERKQSKNVVVKEIAIGVVLAIIIEAIESGAIFGLINATSLAYTLEELNIASIWDVIKITAFGAVTYMVIIAVLRIISRAFVKRSER